jgi:hypothetical protein
MINLIYAEQERPQLKNHDEVGQFQSDSHRCKEIYITVMCFISSNNLNNIAEGGVKRQAPIINSDGRSWNILNVAFVQLLQELGVRMNSFLLEIPHHAMSEFRGDEVAKEVSIEENTLDSKH